MKMKIFEGLKNKNEGANDANIEEKVAELFARLEGLSEEDQWKELEKIKQEYDFEEKKVHPALEKVFRFARKYAPWGIGIAVGAITYTKFNDVNKIEKGDDTENSAEEKKLRSDPQYIEDTTVTSIASYQEAKTAKENLPPRFVESTYESLPREGKDIYKAMAETNPTPGRYYSFVDKDSALQYIFNGNNELVTKIVIGHGKDQGDEQNTSIKLGYGKGTMTTPAGVYLLSVATAKEDIEEYGKLQLSLFGISILGDTVFLGEHQTYSKHNQLEIRTARDNSPTPDDNNYSNGCINISKENYIKSIQPNFEGDYGEVTFVLPDKKSRESGVKFDVNKLLKQIAPIIIEMADKQLAIHNKTLTEKSAIANNLAQELDNLAREHKGLADRYQQNKTSVIIEGQIVKIKEAIKAKKESLGKMRGEIKAVEEKIERVKTKRDKAKIIRDSK